MGLFRFEIKNEKNHSLQEYNDNAADLVYLHVFEHFSNSFFDIYNAHDQQNTRSTNYTIYIQTLACIYSKALINMYIFYWSFMKWAIKINFIVEL